MHFSRPGLNSWCFIMMFCSWLDKPSNYCFGSHSTRRLGKIQVSTMTSVPISHSFGFYYFLSFSHLPSEIYRLCGGDFCNYSFDSRSQFLNGNLLSIYSSSLYCVTEKKDTTSSTEKWPFFSDHFWYSIVLAHVYFVMIIWRILLINCLFCTVCNI